VVLQLGGLGEVLTTPHLKKLACYETGSVAFGLDGSFGLINAKEK